VKICFIAPGQIEIPPRSWGALETVVYNQSEQLKTLGHETIIINEKTAAATYDKVESVNPDVIHLHYGCHYEILPHFGCRKIVTCHDGSYKHSIRLHEMVVRKYLYDCEFFSLTKFEKDFLIKLGISPNRIKILPNGVSISDFKPWINLTKKTGGNDFIFGNSICLGKIDARKRQAQLQKAKIPQLFFAGKNESPDFDIKDRNYLGEWSREDVYNKLPHFTNLILLSESELQPLVCLEALASSLGLVISEACIENLDLSKKFISVIPDSQLNNYDFIQYTIHENGLYSVSHRQEIVDYAAEFDWKNIAAKYNSYLNEK